MHYNSTVGPEIDIAVKIDASAPSPTFSYCVLLNFIAAVQFFCYFFLFASSIFGYVMHFIQPFLSKVSVACQNIRLLSSYILSIGFYTASSLSFHHKL